MGAERGLPLVRHLILEFPEDRNVWGIETEYLFGEEILVAPVVVPMEEAGEEMEVYFPKGRWFDFWTKREVISSSGEWRDVPVPGLESMAMWVRDGAVLAYAKEGRLRTWNRVGEVVKVECYGGPREEGRWECGDGVGAKVAVVRDENSGKWVVEGREREVYVSVYEE
jgi:alpha-glucosidase (family GH31 glycosyl hydrolase)